MAPEIRSHMAFLCHPSGQKHHSAPLRVQVRALTELFHQRPRPVISASWRIVAAAVNGFREETRCCSATGLIVFGEISPVAVIRHHSSGRQDNIHGKLTVKQPMPFSQSAMVVRLNEMDKESTIINGAMRY